MFWRLSQSNSYDRLFERPAAAVSVVIESNTRGSLMVCLVDEPRMNFCQDIVLVVVLLE